MKKMMLLVNPNAGKGGYKTVLGEVLHIFCEADWEPTVFFTRASGEAPGLVQEHVADYDLVVCIGGDGTLSEVTAGMMRLGGDRRPIGYIPLGTANDVARTLGLSPRPLDAAKNILSGRPFPLDVGKFGRENFFTYVAAFGAFTEVSYATPQETKHALGYLAYPLEALRRLPMITDYHAVVEYDGNTIEDDFVFGGVTNSTSVAGLVRLDADTVNLADGMFEVILVRKPLDLLDLSSIVTSILSNDFSGPNVMFLKSREIRFRFDGPVAWTRDGEDGGSHTDVLIHNCHSAVEIIV